MGEYPYAALIEGKTGGRVVPNETHRLARDALRFGDFHRPHELDAVENGDDRQLDRVAGEYHRRRQCAAILPRRGTLKIDPNITRPNEASSSGL